MRIIIFWTPEARGGYGADNPSGEEEPEEINYGNGASHRIS